MSEYEITVSVPTTFRVKFKQPVLEEQAAKLFISSSKKLEDIAFVNAEKPSFVIHTREIEEELID